MTELSHFNPTTRFSDRAEVYSKHRPSYPPAVMDFLKSRNLLAPHHLIADIGAGTGIFAKPFLENGNRVFCVEPNKEMREQGELHLKDFNACSWLSGAADATGLPEASIDIIACAQAFHWFDAKKAKAEFLRVGKPACLVILIWNSRKTVSSPFMREYEALLRQYAKDYEKINENKVKDDKIRLLFGKNPAKEVFANYQTLTLEGFMGRAFSSSYMPQPQSVEFAATEKALRDLFNFHQVEGRVLFEYETQMYYGNIQFSTR